MFAHLSRIRLLSAPLGAPRLLLACFVFLVLVTLLSIVMLVPVFEQ